MRAGLAPSVPYCAIKNAFPQGKAKAQAILFLFSDQLGQDKNGEQNDSRKQVKHKASLPKKQAFWRFRR